MIVRAVHDKENRWFPALRDPFQNRSLSWAARGLLAFLLSKGNEWKPNTKNLIEEGDLKKDGVQGMLRELVKHGHLVRRQIHVQGGQLEWELTVYENPADNPERENPAMVSPEPDLPAPVQPAPVQPAPVNPALYKIQNTTQDREREIQSESESVRVPESAPALTPENYANPYDSPAVQTFEKVLAVRPVIHFAERIAREVTDLRQWEETLAFWNRKNYRKSGVDRMLDNYRKHVEANATVTPLPAAQKQEPTDAEKLATVREMASVAGFGELQVLNDLAAQIAARGGPKAEWEFFVCDFLDHQQPARPKLYAVK